ncbi:hypothetical protein RRF57_011322 [Xylaria bambusicola]|uniref:Uncharacterized protein n=1 Tax=Xylaria bambusicola TaxID=326684 RepID=A0AAN7UYG9_9PEZI
MKAKLTRNPAPPTTASKTHHDEIWAAVSVPVRWPEPNWVMTAKMRPRRIDIEVMKAPARRAPTKPAPNSQ